MLYSTLPITNSHNRFDQCRIIQRIHIIGGPGSGKTYAAGYLSRMLQIPSHDLDELFWDVQAQRYGRRAAEDERDMKLADIARQERWIVEGVYYT